LVDHVILPYTLSGSYEGFNPTTPQNEAGILIDPAVSEPTVAAHKPFETAAAGPLLDPPLIKSGFNGFFTGPNSAFVPIIPKENSSIFNLPIIIAPASFNRLIKTASSVAILSLN